MFSLFFTLVGWTGMIVFLVCHVLLSYERLKPNRIYQALQMLGSVLLGTSALYDCYFQTVGLELFWFFVSLTAFRRLKKGA